MSPPSSAASPERPQGGLGAAPRFLNRRQPTGDLFFHGKSPWDGWRKRLLTWGDHEARLGGPQSKACSRHGQRVPHTPPIKKCCGGGRFVTFHDAGKSGRVAGHKELQLLVQVAGGEVDVPGADPFGGDTPKKGSALLAPTSTHRSTHVVYTRSSSVGIVSPMSTLVPLRCHPKVLWGHPGESPSPG